MKQKHFITVTNPEFYGDLKADAEAGSTNWTIARTAKMGDRIWLYVTRPVMAIVASAIMAEDAVLDEDPSSEWYGSYLADMHSLTMLAKPITRNTLLTACKGWGYWYQPRQSIQVPEYYLERLIKLSEKQP